MNPETTGTGESLASLLDQLHDIREPPPVSLLPATPAWAVVGGLLVLLLIFAVRRWLQYRRANAYRRAALAELHGMESDLAAGEQAAFARLDRILRRTALVAFPREEVAALTGADWAAFLRRTGGADIADRVPDITTAIFARSATSLSDGPGTLHAARDWIRHHHA